MNHVTTFNENIQAINRLLEIHEEITGIKPGYRANVEVLNKSGVVLLVACWEAFIEDLASSSFDFLLSNAKDHTAFPDKVLTLSSKVFWDSKDERGVWLLADSGWKSILQSHKSKVIEHHIGNFNTPRAAQIDTLFESLVGLKSLSSKWYWQKMSSEQAKKKLGDLITLRGSIAHRVETSRAVKKDAVSKNGDFINRLAFISSNTLREYLHSRVGKYPWDEVHVGP